MQYKDYLKFHGEYMPNLDFNKKVHLNPKIYKLSKLFSKKSLMGLDLTPRRNSVCSKEKYPKKPVLVNTSQNPLDSPQFLHLPILPTITENKRSSFIFHNYKLVPQLKKLSQKVEKPPEIRSISNMQTFEFAEIDKYRTNSTSKFSAKIEENKPLPSIDKEEANRKIIYSKKHQLVNVKDFSCAFDYQETHKTYNTSFSNFNS